MIRASALALLLLLMACGMSRDSGTPVSEDELVHAYARLALVNAGHLGGVVGKSEYAWPTESWPHTRGACQAAEAAIAALTEAQQLNEGGVWTEARKRLLEATRLVEVAESHIETARSLRREHPVKIARDAEMITDLDELREALGERVPPRR